MLQKKIHSQQVRKINFSLFHQTDRTFSSTFPFLRVPLVTDHALLSAKLVPLCCCHRFFLHVSTTKRHCYQFPSDSYCGRSWCTRIENDFLASGFLHFALSQYSKRHKSKLGSVRYRLLSFISAVGWFSYPSPLKNREKLKNKIGNFFLSVRSCSGNPECMQITKIFELNPLMCINQ